MLKRLIGVITVRGGWAVQSIGYERYLPLGRAEVLAENLDRWFVDEILLVCIDRTARDLGPDFDLVERLGAKQLMTPLSYAGGVRSAEDAVRLVKLGADRICLDAAFRRAPTLCAEIRDAIGVQAVIRAAPMRWDDAAQELRALDYLTKEETPVDPVRLAAEGKTAFSELLAIDHRGEGAAEAFDMRIVDAFGDAPIQVIAFGGVTTRAQVSELFERRHVSAAAVGNSLAYRELANRDLVSFDEMHDTRFTTHGDRTRGVREW